jgi:hypothetical protein
VAAINDSDRHSYVIEDDGFDFAWGITEYGRVVN